jgi:hypothetical protein
MKCNLISTCEYEKKIELTCNFHLLFEYSQKFVGRNLINLFKICKLNSKNKFHHHVLIFRGCNLLSLQKRIFIVQKSIGKCFLMLFEVYFWKYIYTIISFLFLIPFDLEFFHFWHSSAKRCRLSSSLFTNSAIWIFRTEKQRDERVSFHTIHQSHLAVAS